MAERSALEHAPMYQVGYFTLVVLVFCLASALPASIAHAENPAAAPEFKVWTGDLDGMEDRRLVRILVPYSKTIYFIDGGQQLGTAVDFGNALGKWLNDRLKKTRQVEKLNIAFVPVARGELLDALRDGRGDIVAGALTVTPDRQERIDFSAPVVSGIKEVLVTGSKALPVTSFDDLGGQEIFVRETSSYHEHLLALNAERKRAGKPEMLVSKIDENLEDEDILEMVNAGLLQWAV